MLHPPRPLIASILLAMALLPTRQAHGWIDTGHKVIADIAWDELTPETRAAVLQTLKAHPRFEKDLVRGLPPSTEPSTQPLIADDFLEPLPDAADRHVFANAAVWPDL